VPTSRQVPVTNWKQGERRERNDRVATEVPVALTYNKRSHVVMMVSPFELEDFAFGFSMTEGIITSPEDVVDLKIIQRAEGLEVAMTVNEDCFGRLEKQRRNLVGRTGCGLCGAESLQQAMRTPATVTSQVSVTDMALQNAILSLNAHQPLQSETGAVHGAAWCGPTGEIRSLREDVGRHNALDKLIGSLLREKFNPATGFALVSSRASYEMVYKTAAVGIEVLVAVSAATTLAIDFAQRSGMTLVGFGRPGRHNVYTFQNRISNT
jgi:FdhD protein